MRVSSPRVAGYGNHNRTISCLCAYIALIKDFYTFANGTLSKHKRERKKKDSTKYKQNHLDFSIFTHDIFGFSHFTNNLLL
jgi:hypothetical protein